MAGKRVSLAAALNPAGPPAPDLPAEEPHTLLRPAPVPERAPTEVRLPIDHPGRVGGGEEQRPRRTARWQQLERKEARLGAEQWDELSRLTRQLNRARAGAGERITDNTLIRVAIDLLLEHRDVLRGTTEDELRRSVLRAPGTL